MHPPYFPAKPERIVTVTAHYYLGQQLAGQSTFLCPNGGSLSEMFVCTTCGEVWGRIFIPGATWGVHQAPCQKHAPTGVPDWGRIPGSMLAQTLTAEATSTMFWGSVIEHLPKSLWERELNIHLQYQERFLK